MGDTGNQLAYSSHFFCVHQLVAQHRGIGDVGQHRDDAGDDALLIAHGAEIDGELSGHAVSADNLQFKVVDLLVVERALYRLRESG